LKKSVLAILTYAAFSSMAHAGEPFSTKYQIVVPPAPQFTPTKVWDDGKFTYIQLRAPYHGELPVVFEQLDDGEFAVVDARWDERTSRFVLPKLIDRVVLRLEEKHVEIDRS
jgi:type IV secretory pathway VirB9-like protein